MVAPNTVLPLLLWGIATVVVQHTVMFDFKPETTEEQVALVKAELLKLPQKIPGILSYQLGEDLRLPSGQNINKKIGANKRLCWTATFRTVDVYEAYRTHPEHLQFLSLLKPMMNSRAAIQFETTCNHGVTNARQRSALFVFVLLLVALVASAVL